jgi:hypothetical protein
MNPLFSTIFEPQDSAPCTDSGVVPKGHKSSQLGECNEGTVLRGAKHVQLTQKGQKSSQSKVLIICLAQTKLLDSLVQPIFFLLSHHFGVLFLDSPITKQRKAAWRQCLDGLHWLL